MKKKGLLLLIGLIVIFVLSACGTKSQEEVVKDLNKQLNELKSYKMNAKMTLLMGKEPREYDVEVWHKDPTFYRVNLKNAKKEQNQMILRNDEGVFVLTPALNKSYRFQSEWPQNSSLAYLYESLLKDIVEDKTAKLKMTNEHYVFETKTRYQKNKMLSVQEITIDKKKLTPVSVKVMDPDRNPLVKVVFSKINLDASFDKNAFDTQKNMARAQIDVPATAEPSDEEFATQYPSADIPGVSLKKEKEFNTNDKRTVVLTYGGDGKSFTLIEEQAKAVPTLMALPSSIEGEPVDLGFTIGALTNKTLTWTYDGVEFMLASQDLTPEELAMVARSVQGNQAVK